MKLFAAVILLLLAFTFASAQKKDWQTFTSDEGGFSVLMPDKPTPDTVAVFTLKGQKESHTFSYSDENLNDYLVAYSKFRETDTREMDYDALLDKIQKGILLGEEGKMRSKIALVLDGNPGRELTIEHPDGSIKTHRFYLVGDYFYQLSVEIKRSESKTANTDRFLDSFKLISCSK
jgi:hypothetical protein